MTDNDLFAGMCSMVDGNDQTNPTVEVNETEVNPVEQTVETNSTNTYSFTLSKDEFVKFSNTLKIIQDICNDCDIEGGKVRCRTNDHKNMIYMDLNSVVGDRNITFSGLKNKLLQLDTFNYVADAATDTTILIESNDSNFEFSDSISRLSVRRPIQQYLENTYMDDNEFNTIISCCNREDTVLFNVTINANEKKRIAKLCDIFGTNTVTFDFEGDVARYKTQTSSKDNVSKTSQTVALRQNITGKKTLINNLSFIVDTPSNLEITCYLCGTEYCMFKSKLNYFGIPIVIYTKSRILDINEES